MKTLFLITLILFSASNSPPVFVNCRYKMTAGEFHNSIMAANKYRKLANMKYHFYRVTNGLEPLSPIWKSLTDLETAIKELEQ